VGKPEGKRPLGRPRRTWKDNIKIDLTEIWWGSVDWIHLAQGRGQWRDLVNKLMNLRVPQKVENSSLVERLLASQVELCSMELIS
jgi:hypothetical protein